MKYGKRILILLILLMLLPVWTLRVSANSAEPPSVTILVSHAPEDLRISVTNSDQAAIRVRTRAWETYFRLYMEGIPDHHIELLVESGEKTFRCNLPQESYNYYSNVVTLDYEAERAGFSSWS